MNLGFEKKLIESFPLLFANVKQDGKIKNCMWFGCSVGDGWYPLLERICREIYDYCESSSIVPPAFAQIKEKFGLLTIYLDGVPVGHDEIYRIVHGAREASFFVCENCGTTKDVSSCGSWVLTLCNKCRKKHENNRIYRYKFFRKLIMKFNKFKNYLEKQVSRDNSKAIKREKILDKCCNKKGKEKE